MDCIKATDSTGTRSNNTNTMCFSAAASFTAAGFLVVVGISSIALVYLRAKPTMSRMQQHALASMAAMSLIFGFHQLSEGIVWLDPDNQAAVRFYAYTAYTFWPMYVSLSVLWIELTRSPSQLQHEQQSSCINIPRQNRRYVQFSQVILGVTVFATAAACLIIAEPINVKTNHDQLDYSICNIPDGMTEVWLVAYVYTVVTSLVVSSSIPFSTLLGLVVLASFVITILLWKDQVASTWCFFAAFLSSLLLLMIWTELQMYPEVNSDTISSSSPSPPTADAIATEDLEGQLRQHSKQPRDDDTNEMTLNQSD